MRGTILEVRSDQPRKTAAVLRDRIGKESVGLFGDRVHVVTREPERSEREVRSALAEHGISSADVRAVEPSLEDVFVSVLGGPHGGE